MKIFNECNLQVAWIVGKINPPTFSATCIVKGTYQLYPEEKAKLVKEQEPPLGDLFVDNDMDKSCIHESDFACFKPRTDLALFGKCHAIDNQPVKGCRVTFRVGEIGRSLFIFGNRQWEQSIGNPPTISDPAPFTEMSLIYENSFGGFGFPNNPHGKGWKKTVRS